MRICFIATRFFSGGFTSSMVSMINALGQKGNQVDVLLLDPKNNDFNPDFTSNVQVIGAKFKFKNPFEALFNPELRKTIFAGLKADFTGKRMKGIEKKLTLVRGGQLMAIGGIQLGYKEEDLSSYDCVVSWEEVGCNIYLAEKVTAKYKIGFIHPDYVAAGFNAEVDLPILEKLDRIVAISQANEKTLKEVFPSLASKITSIHNILDVSSIEKKAEEGEKPFTKSNFDLVTVCRLDNTSKALDRAIRITKRLNEDGLSFQWIVVGEGPSRAEVEHLLEELKVSNFVLVGNKNNPYPYVKEADCFVLQSYYEGKPLVVDEALILKTPVLVTHYASATEQVQDGVTGFIVENEEEAIYQKLKDLILHKESIERMKQNLEKEDTSKYCDVNPFLELLKHEGNL